MENWTPSDTHSGYRSKTFQVGACTITVLRPELTGAERAKREEQVKQAAAHMLTAMERRRTT